MGNVHAFAHRVTAVSVACLATLALVFAVLSGFNCNYIKINPMPGRQVMTPDGLEFSNSTSTSIGVQCDSPFYTEEDRMWNLSQTFLYIGLAFGSLTTLMAWGLCVLVPPSPLTWRSLSVLAACTAVLEVPIFLIFESMPCNMDIGRQTCSIGTGAYFNVASIALFVVMTLWTQCLNPPDWTKETEAWRVKDGHGMKIGEISIPSGGDSRDENGTEEESFPRDMPPLEVTRGSPPRAPAYWNVQPKRPESAIPFDEQHYREEQYRMALDVDNHFAHEADNECGAVYINDEPEEQEVTKSRSLWGMIRGRSGSRSHDSRSRPSNSRTSEGEEIMYEEESGAQSTRTPASSIRQVYPIQGPFSPNDPEEVEIPPYDVNRDRSMMDTETDDDEDSGRKDRDGLVRKGAAVVIASLRDTTNSMRTSLRKSLSKNESIAEPGRKNGRGLKVTIICPDGTTEMAKVGGGSRSANSVSQNSIANSAGQPASATEQPVDKTAQMGSRDFVLTHSIPRRPSAPPRDSVSEDLSANIISRLRQEKGQTKKQKGTPVQSFSIRAASYDVSEITPGPADEQMKDETMAILEDLAQLEL